MAARRSLASISSWTCRVRVPVTRVAGGTCCRASLSPRAAWQRRGVSAGRNAPGDAQLLGVPQLEHGREIHHPELLHRRHCWGADKMNRARRQMELPLVGARTALDQGLGCALTREDVRIVEHKQIA
jgi:hypothetical protein